MPDLPMVILIGDSIRMGYQADVQRQLEGVAQVWGPEPNGGNSANVLAHLEEWALARPAELIHVNCGLHDLRKEFVTGTPAIDLASYEANVRTLLQRLQTASAAHVVWATTTPVNEDWHHARKGFDRFAADVDAYNRAATGVATALGVAVDDLFSVVQAAGRDRLLRDDGVHFTPEGYAVLGEAVANCVRGLLGR